MAARITFYAELVRSCRDSTSGRAIHKELGSLGLDKHTYLGNLLVQMYGRCGCLQDASAAFHKLANRNVYSWTLLMGAALENGLSSYTLLLFQRMLQEGLSPDRAALLTVFKAISHLKCLQIGQELEVNLQLSDVSDPTLLTALLNMYAACGSLRDAQRVFSQMICESEGDVVAWNSMLTAFAREEDESTKLVEAVPLFQRMLAEGVKPNSVTYAAVLGVCSKLRLVVLGRAIHQQLVSCGLAGDIFLATSLVHLYSRCWSLGHARDVFDGAGAKRSLVCWNAMIAAYARYRDPLQVLKLFAELQLEGLKPSAVTLISVLGSCVGNEQLELVRKIQQRVETADSEFLSDDVVLRTSLVSSFCECGSITDAEALFYRMSSRSTASWNTMIAAYVHTGEFSLAVHLLHQMENEGIKPNEITFLEVAGSYSGSNCLSGAKLLHERVILACSSILSTELGTAMINMFANCESLEDSERVFSGMFIKDLVTWNAMISCSKDPATAVSWYGKMQLEGVKPDRTTFTIMFGASRSLTECRKLKEIVNCCGFEMDEVMAVALIEKYGQFGEVSAAREVFHKLLLENKSSVVAWTAMVSVYLERHEEEEEEEAGAQAWDLFQRMNLEGVRPNTVTLISLLPSCSLVQGKKLHTLISSSEHLQLNELVGSALINMFSRYGKLEKAREVFDSVPLKNNVCWNSLLKTYAKAGYVDQVLELFKQMTLEGVEPNTVTFILVLHVCSHAGMVEQACELFYSLTSDHQLPATMHHYICLIDALSRAGWLENALELIDKMPYLPNSLAWKTLLAACRLYGDMSRGVVAAEQLNQLKKGDDGAAYVLLSNMLLSNKSRL